MKYRLPIVGPSNVLVLVAALFVGIYVCTIPMWAVFHRHKGAISNSILFLLLNTVFVQQVGYVWFTAAFAWRTYLQAERVANCVTYALNTAIGVVFHVWCFGPLIVERLNVASGGHCLIGSEIMSISMHKCRSDPNAIWVDGFDLSGHYYFITTLCMLLVHNCIGDAPADNVHKAASALCAVLVAVWVFEFWITSLFFHTILERLTGLVGIPIAFGVICAGEWWCGLQIEH